MEMLLDGENMFKNQKLCSRIAKKCPKYVLDCNYIINKNVITAIMHSKPAEKHKKKYIPIKNYTKFSTTFQQYKNIYFHVIFLLF